MEDRAELFFGKSWFQIDAKWEELVRRYERSKPSGTRTAALDDDIESAAIEALFPVKFGTASCNDPCKTDHVRVGSK